MSPAALRELLRAHEAARGAGVLKQTARVRVTRVPFDTASDAVCKEQRAPGLRRRTERLLRGTRPERAARAAQALEAAGFAVPAWLGHLREGPRAVGFARHVPGPTLARALEEADPAAARRLALAAVELAASLHRAGFAVRDFKPPNLIVAADGGLVLVDLDDVRGPRRVPQRYAWRHLAALDAYTQAGPRPPGVSLRLAALRRYARLRGLDPGELLRRVLPRARAKRRAWARSG